MTQIGLVIVFPRSWNREWIWTGDL